VSGGVLQSISWVYKNPANGATLGTAPSYLSSIQVQVDGISGGRIYNSENLPPTVTSHTLTSAVNWASVGTVYMTYSDSLGNHYVVSFSKP
jgi:hypothetical protein